MEEEFVEEEITSCTVCGKELKTIDEECYALCEEHIKSIHEHAEKQGW